MNMKLHANPSRVRKGFTLIEILVVIGILALLLGLITMALKKPSNVAKAQLTQTQMATIQSAMDELRRAGGLDKLPAIALTKTQGVILDKTAWTKSNEDYATNTGITGKVLYGIPANKTNFNQLSKDRLIIIPNVNNPNLTDRLFFLDGWSNPILFIPKSGFPLPTGQFLTSAGTVNAGNVPPNAKAFWMSAGPDGDYSATSDNIYSFQ
jgi:prepilin-type N-terminal cleavage/methylation domain-containing protein